jgi:hypothetical protein
LPAVEAPKGDARQAETAVDSGVERTGRQAEQSIDQALPPPTTPAPDPADAASAALDQGIQQASGHVRQKADAASAALDQGIQRVTGQVQQKTDELNKDIHQVADKLEQKAQTQARRLTDGVLNKVGPKAKGKIKQEPDRAGEGARREDVPNP